MPRIVGRPQLVEVHNVHGIVTVAPQMLKFLDLVRRVAKSDSSVLIRGATGTGKELVARALHTMSGRSEGPFEALNCAMLTPELLASELFGHVRGAFTGAVASRRGVFSMADTGTVFLDEISEMPLDIQARLLRVLQERTFVPLGATAPLTVDVRVLSATHRALRDEVRAGRFREDLMYRVRVVPLFLPRLADRDGDVQALAWHFIDEFNARGLRQIQGIDAVAVDAMLAYSWPGNVRELHNVVEHAFAIGEGPVLRLEDLTPELRGEPPYEGDPEELDPHAAERRRILEALDAVGGRRSDAAEALGMSRTTLWRKLREYQIR
ncbi:MAG: sigma 54-interacting transcriptional regulator [Deltaproteobacteria bacterium]|jgi:two-component system response regulator AtoC|nr:sigma 54-interacting transcriptional regulator [Deltaproteobacteria bacterium]MBW2533759.1 sigma 54-interacting transcriptional regulator [Deltaproteobacteria bacterium]